VIKPASDVVDDLGRFLFTRQWFDQPDDPFGRGPSVMSYDRSKDAIVQQDHRAWIAGLSDEGGAGSWLAAAMKLFGRPDAAELRQYQRFVDEVLWGRIQYAEGDRRYASGRACSSTRGDALVSGGPARLRCGGELHAGPGGPGFATCFAYPGAPERRYYCVQQVVYIIEYMKQLLIELDDDVAARLEQVAPGRARRRSEFIRMAVRRALWELEEQQTAEAYRRQPDSAAEAHLDPAVWEPRPRRRVRR
jgi:predicted transcriptional regulator